MTYPIRDSFFVGADRRLPLSSFVERIFSRSPRPTAALENHLREFVRIEEILACGHRALSEKSFSSSTAFDELIDGLAGVRAHGGAQGWAVAVSAIRRHPLLTLLHQEDLMRRAYHAPAGSAGDIVRLSGMADPESVNRPAEALTELGVRLRERLMASSLAQSMMNRTAILARAIDRTADAVADGAEVLALDCGDLGEARFSRAVGADRLRRFVALDHDYQATEIVERAFGRARVNTIHTPTYALLYGASNALGRFDLIYSASLLERLETRAAAQALGAMHSMLKPGGRIVVANLAPTVPEAGLIEAVMNWWPIYRDHAALSDLGAEIAQTCGAEAKVTLEPGDNIHLLELICLCE
jgi:extracellular factor (EF) 3-hydroxypalmitic acid methyl ester biosynthesis protein